MSTNSRVRYLTYAAVIALLGLLPVYGYPIHDGLDISWIWAINEAFAHGLSWGTDFVFPHGPWGILYAPVRHPDTFPVVLAVWAGLSVGAGAAVGDLMIATSAGTPAKLAAPLALVLLSLLVFDAFWFALIVLYTASAMRDPQRPVRWSTVLLAAVLGLVSTVKFTFLVASLLMVAGSQLYIAFRYRRVNPDLPVYLLATAVFWTLSGQSLGGLPHWLSAAVELSAGYPEAMGIEPSLKALVPVFYALCFLGFLAVSHVRRRPAGRRLDGAMETGLLLLLLVLVAKADLTRHYGVMLTATTAAAFMAFGHRLAWGTGWRRGVAQASAVAGTIVVAHVGIGLSQPNFGLLAMVRGQVQETKGIPEVVGDVLGDRSFLNAVHASASASLREQVPLPDLDGPVKVFPVSLTVAYAHHLDVATDPLPQAYSAYTPDLVRRDATRFAERPPRWILWEHAPIDGRLVTMEDAGIWEAMIRGYRMVDKTDRFAILGRREHPLTVHTAAVDRIETGIGQPFVVETNGIVRLRAHFEWRPLDRLVRLVAPPLLWLKLDYPDGRTALFRLPTGIAEAGFLLEPEISDLQTFERFLATVTSPADRPATLTATILRRSGPPVAPLIRLEIEHLDFAPE